MTNDLVYDVHNKFLCFNVLTCLPSEKLTMRKGLNGRDHLTGCASGATFIHTVWHTMSIRKSCRKRGEGGGGVVLISLESERWQKPLGLLDENQNCVDALSLRYWYFLMKWVSFSGSRDIEVRKQPGVPWHLPFETVVAESRDSYY